MVLLNLTIGPEILFFEVVPSCFFTVRVRKRDPKSGSPWRSAVFDEYLQPQFKEGKYWQFVPAYKAYVFWRGRNREAEAEHFRIEVGFVDERVTSEGWEIDDVEDPAGHPPRC